MKRLLLTLVAGFTVLNGTQVLAADFLFQVPVKLEKIPKGIAQAKIHCDVFSYRDNINPIASGYTIRPIDSHGGTLRQEIDVNVNYLNKYRHHSPHQYRCHISLLTPWAKPSWQTPAEDSPIPALQPRDNSQLVTEVSGLIQ